MEPPWALDPDFFSDGRWILGESDYLRKWRSWFVALPEEAKSDYMQANPVLDDAGAAFYDVFGVPPYDPAQAAEKFRDPRGRLAPPWLAFPDIPLDRSAGEWAREKITGLSSGPGILRSPAGRVRRIGKNFLSPKVGMDFTRACAGDENG